MEHMRRQDDQRFQEVLDSIADFKEHLNQIENKHEGFYGRMDERVIAQAKEIKKHSDELQAIYKQRSDDRIANDAKLQVIADKQQALSEWQANSIGQKTVIKAAAALFFSAVGGAIMWLAQHFLTPLLKGASR